MAPTWLPLCKSMQRYCEPYFAAIERWRTCEDRNLLMNRILLVETACKIFREYSEGTDTYFFDIACDRDDLALLDEVLPTAGKVFVVSGDIQAYEHAKRLVPEGIFVKAGVFFQNNLLKAMAGWNAEILAASNMQTRKSIIASVEKLLRLQHAAGVAKFTFRRTMVGDVEVSEEAADFPSPLLSEGGRAFFDFLLEARRGDDHDAAHKKRPAPVGTPEPSGKKARSSRNGGKRKGDSEEEASEASAQWLKKHPSVGTQVAAYFPSEDADAVDGQKAYTGEVKAFMAPSAPQKRDQLYHVRWSDGDEQDYDEGELRRGVELFDELNGWTKTHESIGWRVAALFPAEAPSGKKGAAAATREYEGLVIKHAPATADSPALWHVVWEDGDEQDYDEGELQAGRERYLQSYSSKALAAVQHPAKAEKRSPRKPDVVASPPKAVAVKVEKAVEEVESAAEPMAVDTLAPAPAAEEVAVKVEAPATTREPVAAVAAVPAASPPSSSSKRPSAKPRSAEKPKKAAAPVADEPLWIFDHASVGTEVAAYFPCSPSDPAGVVLSEAAGKSKRGGGSAGGASQQRRVKPFKGAVTKYALPSSEGEADQLYHVVWEDGDEEDYDEADLQRGVALKALLDAGGAQGSAKKGQAARRGKSAAAPELSHRLLNGSTVQTAAANSSSQNASNDTVMSVNSSSGSLAEAQEPAEAAVELDHSHASNGHASPSGAEVAALEARILADEQQFVRTHPESAAPVGDVQQEEEEAAMEAEQRQGEDNSHDALDEEDI